MQVTRDLLNRGQRNMVSGGPLTITLLLLLSAGYVAGILGSRKGTSGDITLYIDESQVREFSGFPMEIFAISDGVVLPYILDPNFEKYLPVIPSDVDAVNFTWKSGDHHYYYDFELKSFNKSLLNDPILSIDRKGKVPRKSKTFKVFLPCFGNESGVATFSIGLRIQNDRGLYLSGTPLSLQFKKECANCDQVPDPECDKKCANGGRCNQQKICECPKGYMGKYCHSALCYPQCINGICVSPGVCSCSEGYQGPNCEGGMCEEKCLNGGKCIQKDVCFCKRGYYGKRCEYSKCNIPCLNGGRCVGINRCRCKKGYVGKQCENIVDNQHIQKNEGCKKKCVHGVCHQKQCSCDKGWFGKRCSRRKPRQRHQKKTHL